MVNEQQPPLPPSINPEVTKAPKGSDTINVPQPSVKRKKFGNWSEFKEAQSKYPKKEPFLPIAEVVHNLLVTTLNENHLPFDIRYGDGTFSVSVAKDRAKSGTRTCARFGLLDMRGESSYLESLYKEANAPLPQGAEYWRKNDLTQYQYSFYLDSRTSLQDIEESIKGSVLKSYLILAKT